MSSMQPETPQPAVTGLEQAPKPPVQAGGEFVPSLPPIDTGIERGADRVEQVAEASAVASDLAGAPVALPMPPVADPVSQHPDPVTTGAASNPVTAADDDVIEKEWVDKAKDIIQKTKNDPFTRTNQVNELQRDYMKKRFGKEIGVST